MEHVDISLIVALRSGIMLALKYIKRLLLVIGVVALVVLVTSGLFSVVMAVLAPIFDSNVLKLSYLVLSALLGIAVSGVFLWYFKELLSFVRGHTRSFADIKKLFMQGWKLFIAKGLYALVVFAPFFLLSYVLHSFIHYNSLPKVASILIEFFAYVPSLYIAARFCLYPYFLADGSSVVDSLRSSFMLTCQHALKLVLVGIVRMATLGSMVVLPLTLPDFFKIGSFLISSLFVAAVIDLAGAHIYQRLTHPDQASVPPGVHPLD